MYSLVNEAYTISLHYVRQPQFDHSRCGKPIQTCVPVMLKCEEVNDDCENGLFLWLEKEVFIMLLWGRLDGRVLAVPPRVERVIDTSGRV